MFVAGLINKKLSWLFKKMRNETSVGADMVCQNVEFTGILHQCDKLL